MSIAGAPQSSLRLERAESSRLVWAFAISLALHLLGGGVYEAGKSLHWWQNWQWPAWMQTPRMLAQLFQKPLTPKELAEIQERLRRQQSQFPTAFLEINPAKATVEAPKKAEYYSDRNSLAANPDASRNSDRPKIDGTQTEVAKTEDVLRPKAFPLQPAPPVQKEQQASPKIEAAKQPPDARKAPEPAQPRETAKTKPSYTPGDLALAKPADATRKAQEEAKAEALGKVEPVPEAEAQPEHHTRPRTVAEAKARLEERTGSVGQKMKQEGGVRRRDLDSSFDAQETAFGAYDAKVVDAVRTRWYELLAEQRYAEDRTGKVSFKFHMNSDGTVSQMKMTDNTVDLIHALLCESAIRENAPFDPWPDEMRRIIGESFREVTFTFYYH